MYYLLACYLLFLSFGCDYPENKKSAAVENVAIADSIRSSAPDTIKTPTKKLAPAPPTPFVLSYQLDDPVRSLELPSRLDEVSGLGFTENKSRIASVQDEKGNIYLVNKYDGKVEEKIDFAKDDDYEGVEIIGENGYVINSSGTIYEVLDLKADEDAKINRYNTFLTGKNNVEGLAFDPDQNSLLLACKGRPAEGESLFDFRQKKTIYAFDLEKKELRKEPAYTITLAGIQAYLKIATHLADWEELNEQFGPEEDQLEFNPSAIALHPQTKDLYILSSAGKTFMVLGRQGRIKHMEKLEKKIHRQPEGITFDKDGTLYISNEGRGKKAVIHVFPSINN